jgi:hypothetical protein
MLSVTAGTTTDTVLVTKSEQATADPVVILFTPRLCLLRLAL